ncbi:PhzF family phenazine biosynthesis protein [Deinococcus metallilatus]|uniref:PhzF family phenazine biosynthesis protein n=1 Tax=Deinococcus metallilatus TaxID=1211322 RepID=A0AAJ5JYX7_9DEIO|nr:PhzF family phenazine biosynthesis protein [Deinococcus metallilatus]MBB5294967.1 PhzF family phenazine biosynthesis protein [Deinococcus metallilatus]QBY09339.1 PhzF family phenazine biosynthesis protein [Deinococcus metallilatus]RXJ09344.1 PhzF family phenazine biosynthesis protein [Deinococcus metallilatus]TLK28866.1 PhzF family phenazine biosynthesis protein [Deinococcus metallilatus]
MNARRFTQLDVFGSAPCTGNPLATVIDGAGLTTAAMQRFARWTNLSETTFLLPATTEAADYRVRIFTPVRELPFAGHPTLGSCQAWLEAGGQPRAEGMVVQECQAGLIEIRRGPGDGRLAFAAPPRRRTGPLDAPLLNDIVRVLRIPATDVVAHQWVDNGPGWVAVMLRSAAQVKALNPDFSQMNDLELGVIAPYPAGSEAQFEVRAFISQGTAVPYEDPVTGSLNASLAQWLMEAELAPARYVASQGTALGRQGRVYLERDSHGGVWVGGHTFTAIHGTVYL